MRESEKERPRRCWRTPEPGPQGGNPMARERILQDVVSNEVRRRILRESINRYRKELLDDEERQLLLDRIRRLRRALGVFTR